MIKTAQAALVVVAASLAGCSTQTVGEACDDFAGAFCTRMIDCGAMTHADRADCVYALVGGCCSGAGCQGDVASQANVDRCIADIHDVTCGAMTNFVNNPSTVTAPVPGICRGVAAPK